jgi:capsular exopolysaccharide synthesis family protein
MLSDHGSIVSIDGARGAVGGSASSLLQEASDLWTRVSGGRPASGVHRMRIGVCATFPGEGATSVAANFAIFLARRGTRTALLEANLRRPSLSRHFGVQASPGLWELLEGTARPPEILRRVCDNLNLIRAGSAPNDFAAEFDLAKFTRIVQLAERSHDVTVIDLPALAVAPEALPMMRDLDSVVLVVRANKTRKADVRRTVRRIQEQRVHLAGVVLNDMRYEIPAFLEALV